jgi:hypothetical protein
MGGPSYDTAEIEVTVSQQVWQNNPSVLKAVSAELIIYNDVSISKETF